jgi:pimeloyl-ACP methyl ester carboxylesterase
MPNFRTYGPAPFRVAVVHGGPGAPGHMAPVAHRLSGKRGVLEPLQTATSVDAMVDELRNTLVEHGSPPATLIGSSWGAMLAFLLAGRHPELVQRLVLVGSGAFDARYAPLTLQTRLGRLNPADRAEVQELLEKIEEPGADPSSFARFGELLGSVDTYDGLTADEYADDLETLEEQPEIYRRVWPEVEKIRTDGVFLELAERIECPVLAIHGDYDSHPAEGVREPLGRLVKDFRFVLLERCGHIPWTERHARERFYEILEDELG